MRRMRVRSAATEVGLARSGDAIGGEIGEGEAVVVEIVRAAARRRVALGAQQGVPIGGVEVGDAFVGIVDVAIAIQIARQRDIRAGRPAGCRWTACRAG
jgi:hypothetical protein